MQLRLGQAYQNTELKKRNDVFVIVEFPIGSNGEQFVKTYNKRHGEKLFGVEEFVEKIKANSFIRCAFFDKPGQLDFWFPNKLSVELYK